MTATHPSPAPSSSSAHALRRGVARLGLCAWALCGPTLAHAADAPAAPPAPLAPIANLDLPRYMGTWYEVAKFPNRFQGQCAGPASADYRLQPGGTVQVVNRCPLADGKVDEAVGEARRVGPEGSPKLEVRFAPAWLSWLPFVWGNYWVVDLDAGYQLAVVSEPKREFLWVLSRRPAVEAAVWDALMARLRVQGFDLSRLQRADTRP